MVVYTGLASAEIKQILAAHIDLRPAIEEALDQIRLFLQEFSTRYPILPRHLGVHRPILQPPRTPTAYAVVCGRLEAQFHVVKVNLPPPGAVLEVLGFDYQ